MNPIVGWGLAFVALVAGWLSYGWQGVVMVVSAIVFWLLVMAIPIITVIIETVVKLLPAG